MSDATQLLSLPADGEQITRSTMVAAAMAACGVGGRPRTAEHVQAGRGVDGDRRAHFSWELMGNSTTLPEFDVRDIYRRHTTGQMAVNENTSRNDLFFLAGLFALETRQMALAARWQGLNFGLVCEGARLCRGRASGSSIPNDLCVLARHRAAHSPVCEVRSAPLLYAMAVVGFPIVEQVEEKRWMVPAESLTFPGLMAPMLGRAWTDIRAYDAAVVAAAGRGAVVVPEPPQCDLPGAPAGEHPFQFAAMAVMNQQHLLNLVRGKEVGHLSSPIQETKTLFLRHGENAMRTAILDQTADGETIAEAVRHVS